MANLRKDFFDSNAVCILFNEDEIVEHCVSASKKLLFSKAVKGSSLCRNRSSYLVHHMFPVKNVKCRIIDLL